MIFWQIGMGKSVKLISYTLTPLAKLGKKLVHEMR